jgi:hypothetical protein
MGDKTPSKGSGSSGGKYTSPGQRPGAGANEGVVAVHLPSRTMNVPVQYPMLTETNYNLWATKMKLIMRLLGV